MDDWWFYWLWWVCTCTAWDLRFVWRRVWSLYLEFTAAAHIVSSCKRQPQCHIKRDQNADTRTSKRHLYWIINQIDLFREACVLTTSKTNFDVTAFNCLTSAGRDAHRYRPTYQRWNKRRMRNTLTHTHAPLDISRLGDDTNPYIVQAYFVH